MPALAENWLGPLGRTQTIKTVCPPRDLLEPQHQVGSRAVVPGLPLEGGLAIDAAVRSRGIR